MRDRYAVVGNPVAHSRSPQIHAEFARATGQDLEYGRIEAPLDGFERTLEEFRGQGGKGLNVTVPFKQAAFRYCRKASRRAQAAQVVNTLVLPHVERRVADLPPTVLVLVIVALSQLGLIWVLLATPVAAVAYDLFRYVYGRFAEPPRPAGLLPGEALRGGARRRPRDEAGVV